MALPLYLSTPEFSLFIRNEIKTFLTFFKAEQPLAVFLYEKLTELLALIMGKFIRPAVFAENSSTRKMQKEENLISSDNLHLAVGTTRGMNKCTTTLALEVRRFKQNALRFLIKRLIPLTLQIHTLYIMSLTKPDSFF